MDVVVEITPEPTWTKEADSFRHLVLLLTAEMGARCSQVHAMAEDATVPLAELVNMCHLFTQFCDLNTQTDRIIKHLWRSANLPNEISSSSETTWTTGYEGMEESMLMSTSLVDAWRSHRVLIRREHELAQEEEEEAKETPETPEQVQEISTCYRRVMRLTGKELGDRCALLVSLANDMDATPDILGDIGSMFGELAGIAGTFGEFAACFSRVNRCNREITDEGRAIWEDGFPTLKTRCLMTYELAIAMRVMLTHVRRDKACRGVSGGASGGEGGFAARLAMLASQSR